MMVFMMMFRPFKTLFSVGQTFKAFEVPGSGVNFLGQKIVFVLGNLAGVRRPHGQSGGGLRGPGLPVISGS